MFELLTRVLLWVLIGTIIWYIFSNFINKTYLTWLGGLIVFAFIILAFFNPNDRTVGTVWSILSLPLKPLGLTIFLLLNALKGGTKNVIGNQVVAALLILFFTSTPIMAYWLTAQTEQTAVSTVQVTGDRAPNPTAVKAIVVLGDGTAVSDPSYGVRTQLSNAEDGFGTGLISRLYFAARLYREQVAQGSNPLVIVSAGPQPALDPQDANEAQSVINLLTSAGVPQDRILIDSSGLDVRTSSVAVDQLLTERGFQKASDVIILISPALNTRRATSSFARLGIQTFPRPTDFFAFQLDNSRQLALLADLVPNVEALALTTRVIDEYLTSIYYFLRGWLLNPY
jgi:hypothetical protein